MCRHYDEHRPHFALRLIHGYGRPRDEVREPYGKPLCRRVAGRAQKAFAWRRSRDAHPVDDDGGDHGGITHFESLYWGNSLTL